MSTKITLTENERAVLEYLNAEYPHISTVSEVWDGTRVVDMPTVERTLNNLCIKMCVELIRSSEVFIYYRIADKGRTALTQSEPVQSDADVRLNELYEEFKQYERGALAFGSIPHTYDTWLAWQVRQMREMNARLQGLLDSANAKMAAALAVSSMPLSQAISADYANGYNAGVASAQSKLADDVAKG